MGTAFNQKIFSNGGIPYAQFAAMEYNLITGENACKMGQIARGYNDFNYTGCDLDVKVAK